MSILNAVKISLSLLLTLLEFKSYIIPHVSFTLTYKESIKITLIFSSYFFFLLNNGFFIQDVLHYFFNLFFLNKMKCFVNKRTRVSLICYSYVAVVKISQSGIVRLSWNREKVWMKLRVEKTQSKVHQPSHACLDEETKPSDFTTTTTETWMTFRSVELHSWTSSTLIMRKWRQNF
jgi:hypothetical protein